MSRWNENKLFTEADNGDNRVAVYVGTYGKYNDGSIEGQWVYPADYDTRAKAMAIKEKPLCGFEDVGGLDK